ncbi:MAG: T9SS type A sorting domain-containing protein [Flavobacteriales bacterium]
MYKLVKILLLLIINCSLLINKGLAQNLVPNPSFEDTVSCPTTLADLSATTFWTAPTQGSADYFNACGSGDANVPNNIFGTQSALTGNAYVGIGVYDTFDTYSYREYIQVQMQQNLISGQKYWVSFYVSLADLNDYAIQEIGAYFSPVQINDNSIDTTLSFTPQIEFNDSVITDKVNWTKISGSFTATGNENYVIIGNFNRKQTTTATQVGSTNTDYSYYYIDDVCVSVDSLTCANPVGVSEINLDNSLFTIYPNPVNDYLTVNQSFDEPYDLLIYNTLGQQLFEEKNITSNNKTINTTSFTKGILFITIKSKNQNIYYKLLKL